MGSPLQFLKGIQNWLKFPQVHAYNFEGSGSGYTMPLDVPLGWCVKAGTSFLGNCPLKILEGKKRPKFSAI